jgi:hypothetical protein
MAKAEVEAKKAKRDKKSKKANLRAFLLFFALFALFASLLLGCRVGKQALAFALLNRIPSRKDISQESLSCRFATRRNNEKAARYVPQVV